MGNLVTQKVEPPKKTNYIYITDNYRANTKRESY